MRVVVVALTGAQWTSLREATRLGEHTDGIVLGVVGPRAGEVGPLRDDGIVAGPVS